MTDRGKRGPVLVWAVPLALFVVGLALLHWMSGAPPVHADTDRDLLLARACTQFDRCATAGPVTSFGGLLQGALWIHLLSATRLLGIGIRDTRIALLAAQALSAVLVYEATRRLTPARFPIVAWAASLVLSTLAAEAPLFWNPAIVPLPVALFQCAILLAMRERGSGAYVVAAISLALADSHLTTSALFPWLFVVTTATARRPAIAATTSLFAYVLTTATVSIETTVTHLSRLAPFLPFVLAGLAIVAILGALLRAPLRSLSPARMTALLLASLVLHLGAGLWIAALATGHPLSARYFAGAVPAVSIGAAWALDVVVEGATSRLTGARDAGRWAVRVVLAIAAVTLVAERWPRRDPGWTLDDAQRVGADLYRSGESFESLARRIRGPDAYALVRALGAFEPDGDGAPSPREDASPDLLVLRVLSEHLPSEPPSSWTVIALEQGHSFVARPRESRLDAGRIELCLRRIDLGTSDHDHACVTTSATTWRDPDRVGDLLGRFVPTLDGVVDAFGDPSLLPAGAYAWSVTFPLRRIDSEAAERIVTTVPGDAAAFRVRVASSTGEDSDAGFDVGLLADAHVARVTFEREVTPGSGDGFHGWIPDYAEIGDDEPALRELVRASLEGRR